MTRGPNAARLARLKAGAGSAWRAWVALWAREESPRVLALVRILVAMVILYDFWKVWDLGLVTTLFGTPEAGGLGDVMSRKPVPELYRWFPPGAGTATAAHAVVCVAALCFGMGLLTPVAGIVLLSTWAQLAQVLPLGDRGIDLMLRNCLLILSLSGCGRVWSVDSFFRKPVPRVPAWPRHLLVLQILVMYAAAGIQKTAVSWWPFGRWSALYVILQDPSIAAWRFAWLERVFPLTQLATVATMVFELGAIVMPLAWWFRATRTRPGRLRALFNRLDLHQKWMIVGVFLHVGIAATMSLGIFPYAMLALYPAFLHPDELPRRLRGSPPAEAPGVAAAA
jgi:hypothetical protein